MNRRHIILLVLILTIMAVIKPEDELGAEDSEEGVEDIEYEEGYAPL